MLSSFRKRNEKQGSVLIKQTTLRERKPGRKTLIALFSLRRTKWMPHHIKTCDLRVGIKLGVLKV